MKDIVKKDVFMIELTTEALWAEWNKRKEARRIAEAYDKIWLKGSQRRE